MRGEVIQRAGYIEIVHEHVSEMSDVMQRILEASTRFAEGAEPRLLVDARYYRPVWANGESPQIASQVLTRFPADIRIAVWLREPATAAKVGQVIDRVAAAGLNIKRFKDREEAVGWLLA